MSSVIWGAVCFEVFRQLWLAGGKLYVYTVTASEIKETESPISIPAASSLIVLDKLRSPFV